MGPGQRPKFGRQGEGQQKVAGRHQRLHLALKPLLALVMLAVRTQAMAARVRHELAVRALGAVELHHRTGAAAALPEGGQGPKLIGSEALAVLGAKLGAEGIDDVSEPDHRTRPQVTASPSIRSLICVSAWCWVLLVRWV